MSRQWLKEYKEDYKLLLLWIYYSKALSNIFGHGKLPPNRLSPSWNKELSPSKSVGALQQTDRSHLVQSPPWWSDWVVSLLEPWKKEPERCRWKCIRVLQLSAARLLICSNDRQHGNTIRHLVLVLQLRCALSISENAQRNQGQAVARKDSLLERFAKVLHRKLPGAGNCMLYTQCASWRGLFIYWSTSELVLYFGSSRLIADFPHFRVLVHDRHKWGISPPKLVGEKSVRISLWKSQIIKKKRSHFLHRFHIKKAHLRLHSSLCRSCCLLNLSQPIAVSVYDYIHRKSQTMGEPSE
jgi:hypothetical protein